MNEIASKSQLRMSYMRWALFCAGLLLLLGMGSAILTGGPGGRWYDTLAKPALNPPAAVFAPVWTTLYIVLGLAVAVVADARRAPGKGLAITLFAVQMICNFIWSPLFFGQHETLLAFFLIVVMLVLSIVTAFLFGRIRAVAGLLLVPYIAWLCFAGYLAFEINRLNPNAKSLVAPVFHTQI